MSKVAFIFPGQGSQKVGMGVDLYNNFQAAKSVFEQADEILGFNFTKLCFNGSEEELCNTENSQPAIFTVSVACLEVLKQETGDLRPDFVAGHSAGEYAALVASGALSFEDGISLIRKRGEAMNKAASNHPGGMVAVLGMNTEDLRKSIDQLKDKNVDIVNYNCPGQLVVSGKKEALKVLKDKISSDGLGKVVDLFVSGAFHSSLMQDAKADMEGPIRQTKFHKAEIPIIANYNATAVTDPEEITRALINQITSPVLWEDTTRGLIKSGVELFVEIGPGNVLKGLLKRTDKSKDVLNVEDSESLKESLEKLRSSMGAK